MNTQREETKKKEKKKKKMYNTHLIDFNFYK